MSKLKNAVKLTFMLALGATSAIAQQSSTTGAAAGSVAGEPAVNKPSKFDKKVEKICSKHSNWSLVACTAVAQHRVILGMSAEMVVAAWGRPKTINRTVLSGGVQDQWVFGHDDIDIAYQGKNNHLSDAQWSYVYFENGRVTAIQTQPSHE